MCAAFVITEIIPYIEVINIHTQLLPFCSFLVLESYFLFYYSSLVLEQEILLLTAIHNYFVIITHPKEKQW